MSERLLRKWVKDLLAEVKYVASCAYEVKVNQRLEKVKARNPFPLPDKPRFCFGTTTGGDAEFNALDCDGNPGTYQLELKAGSGGKRDENSGGLGHPTAQAMLREMAKFNTTEYIGDLVQKDIEVAKGKGITIPGNYDSVPQATIDAITNHIVQKQQSQIDAILNGTHEPVSIKFYYYFARTKQASSHLKVPKPFDLSKPDPSIVGTFEKNYASSGTYYIQIEDGGMFWMGQDPLNLASIGVLPFTGSVSTTGRLRWDSGGGGTSDKLDIQVMTNGKLVPATCSISWRSYRFKGNEDIGVRAASGLDLDNDGDLTRFATYCSQPADCSDTNESLLREMIYNILAEAGTVGDDYEQVLIDEFNEAADKKSELCDVRLEKAQTLAYDIAVKDIDPAKSKNCPGANCLAITVGGVKAEIEVKLDKKAQLGKVRKELFSNLIYTVGSPKSPGSFDYTTKDAYTVKEKDVGKVEVKISAEDKDLIDDLMGQLKTNIPAAKIHDEFLTKIAGRKVGDVVDCLDTLTLPDRNGPSYKQQTKKDGTPSKKGNYIDNTGAIIPMQLTSSANLISISGSKMKNYLKHKNYFILGEGTATPNGTICKLGEDVLGFDKTMGDIEFGDVGLEVRWKGSGRYRQMKDSSGAKVNDRTKPVYGFTIESRGQPDPARGRRFNSGAELVEIFCPPINWEAEPEPEAEPGSTAKDRSLPWSRLLGNVIESLITEELTKSDKKEIEKIARKQFDKQLRAPGFKKEVEKIVSEAIKGEFKGKEHEKAVVAISKKVLRAFHTMMYQKRNIIDTMSV